MTVPLFPAVPWTNGVTQVTAEHLNHFRTNLPKACDGVGGGTYQPMAPLVINGEGLGANKFTLTGPLIANGAITAGGIISPSALGATQDDWSPTGLSTCSVIRVTTGGSGTSLTGIAAGDPDAGRIIVLMVVDGGGALTLEDQNAGSAEAHRFAIPAPVAVGVDTCAILFRDGTSQRWRLLS